MKAFWRRAKRRVQLRWTYLGLFLLLNIGCTSTETVDLCKNLALSEKGKVDFRAYTDGSRLARTVEEVDPERDVNLVFEARSLPPRQEEDRKETSTAPPAYTCYQDGVGIGSEHLTCLDYGIRVTLPKTVWLSKKQINYTCVLEIQERTWIAGVILKVEETYKKTVSVYQHESVLLQCHFNTEGESVFWKKDHLILDTFCFTDCNIYNITNAELKDEGKYECFSGYPKKTLAVFIVRVAKIETKISPTESESERSRTQTSVIKIVVPAIGVVVVVICFVVFYIKCYKIFKKVPKVASTESAEGKNGNENELDSNKEESMTNQKVSGEKCKSQDEEEASKSAEKSQLNTYLKENMADGKHACKANFQGQMGGLLHEFTDTMNDFLSTKGTS